MSEKNIVEEAQEELVEEPISGSEEAVKEVTGLNKTLISKPEKIKKHLEAKRLVAEAKSIVEASESDLKDCKLLLESDLRDYAAAKLALRAGGLDRAKELLSQLHGEEILKDEVDETIVAFEAKEDLKPIVIKDVSSGRFSGFLLSLFGGAITLGGLVYLAVKNLDITFYLDQIPSKETIQNIFRWFGNQIGRPDDAINGGLLLGGTVLAVMVSIYALRIWLKGGKNLKFAHKQMNEAQKYITHKTNCKVEMDRVDAHITDAVTVLKDYEIVLNEQNGKLKRVLHFEGNKANISDYHIKSSQEIKETQNLIENIGRFISTPMSEEGRLSEKSTFCLHSAKEVMQKVINRFS